MQIQYGFSRICFIILILFVISTYSLAQNVVNILPGKDNTLYENANGSLSNGMGEYIFAGKNAANQIRRALIAFDIAGNIPAGSTVNEVALTLHMSRTIAQTHTVELRKVLADWGEGDSNAPGEEGGGATAAQGDATWLHTFFDTDFWSNNGGDFSSTVSGSQTIDSLGFYTWNSTAQMVADVQEWLDNPAANFGWLLLGDESTAQSAKRFDSKDNPVQANQPVLTVTYTGPAGIAGGKDGLPLQFELLQNYPNPFNPSTTIRFSLPIASEVKLAVYNLLGQRIRILANGLKPSGSYEVRWNGTDKRGNEVTSGIYLYQLEAENFLATKKMILLR